MHDQYRQRLRRATAGLWLSLAALAAAGAVAVRFPETVGMVWLVQIVLTLAAAAIAWTALSGVQRCLLGPLESLRHWAARMRVGDFSARVTQVPGSAFADLVEDVNRVGDELQVLSRDMESKVQKQTESLEQKTRSLELLYDVAASINVSRDIKDLLSRFLRTLSDVIGARGAAVRLADGEGRLQLVSSVGLDEDIAEHEKCPPSPECLCLRVLQEGNIQSRDDLTSCCGELGRRLFESDDLRLVVVPLQYRNRTFGVYNLFVDEKQLAAHEDVIVLLTSLGQHLGMAIERAGLDKETERLSRMEERNRLANELHDSLAQTLASLRFQVRVLDETLHQRDESATWQKLEQVENNLDEAYRELRELIARFRAPIDQPTLAPSIEKIIQRFKEESGILTFFHNALGDALLPENVELQVVRIVQEALNNVRKHSNANAVRVMMRREPDGLYRVLIEDDGVGFDRPRKSDSPGERIGLSIMRERAKDIGGKLTIESEPSEGTRVHLSFRYPNEDLKTDMFEPKRAAAL